MERQLECSVFFFKFKSTLCFDLTVLQNVTSELISQSEQPLSFTMMPNHQKKNKMASKIAITNFPIFV